MSAFVLLACAAALVCLLAVRLLRSATAGIDVRALLLGAGFCGVLALGFASGRGLRWEQLALSTVTVGDSYTGVWAPAFDDQVRFLLVPGDGEVSPGEYRVRGVAHLIAAPALALGAALLFLVRLRSASSARRSSGATTAPP